MKHQHDFLGISGFSKQYIVQKDLINTGAQGLAVMNAAEAAI